MIQLPLYLVLKPDHHLNISLDIINYEGNYFELR